MANPMLFPPPPRPGDFFSLIARCFHQPGLRLFFVASSGEQQYIQMTSRWRSKPCSQLFQWCLRYLKINDWKKIISISSNKFSIQGFIDIAATIVFNIKIWVHCQTKFSYDACWLFFFFLKKAGLQTFFIWWHRAACGILVPGPGIESKLLAVEARSPNHRMAFFFSPHLAL